jgi:F0F1-type ATP synthase membrane subunit b/b'
VTPGWVECISGRVPERIIKIDAEILAAENKLQEAQELITALTAQISALKKKREAILKEIENEARKRI